MWYIKAYEDNKVVVAKQAKDKYAAKVLYDSMKRKYEDVAVFEDEDYIDPCELQGGQP